MHIELPQDIIQRVQQRTATTHGATEADVIRKALDSLDWMDQERQAIQEGIDAWRAGDVRDFDDFDRQFRAEHGIPADA
jgi:predicted transcriptional regulator